MVWSDEVGSSVRSASRMPHTLVQRAQYMNDVTGSVLGKFMQASNYQKNAEYRGGIWDCPSVKGTVPLESTCLDTSNKLSNKIYSLEEMLASDGEESYIETEEKLTHGNNASCSEMSVDVNNKRWLSEEEFDKTCSIPGNVSVVRKKSKRNVSFSETLVNFTNSSEPTGTSSEFVGLDVIVIEDGISDLKETVSVQESKQPDVNFEINKPISNSEAANESVKESCKVKNWVKLASESSEMDSSNQKLSEPMQVESSKKVMSKKTCKSLKIKSSDHMAEHWASKTSHDNSKLKEEELINRSHLENTIPELFEFCESKTETKIACTSTEKLKAESLWDTKKLNSSQNLGQEIKMNSLSSRKTSSAKYTSFQAEMIPSENNEGSDCFEGDSFFEKKENDEVKLKNLLFKMFNDSEVAESIKTELVKLKNEMVGATKMEKIKSLPDSKPTDFQSIVLDNKSCRGKTIKKQTCHFGNESQYQITNDTKLQEKVIFLPVTEKPSCNQLEKNEKMAKDLDKKVPSTSYHEKNSVNSVSVSQQSSHFVKASEDKNFAELKEMISYLPGNKKPSCNQLVTDEKMENCSLKTKEIEVNTDIAGNKSGKLSPTSCVEMNSNNSVSILRSDSCSNWRMQCADVRQKDTQQSSHFVKASEDKNFAELKEMISYLPGNKKPSCNQLVTDEKMENCSLKTKEIEVNTDIAGNKSGKLSPTSCVEMNSNNSVSILRSDSCSNWRMQCADVRQKDTNETQIPRASAAENWRNGDRNSRSQHYTTARDTHATKRVENWIRKQHEKNELDPLLNVEYEDDPLRVIPFVLKAPPDPLSRFKNINSDPESIWDSLTPEEKAISSRSIKPIHLPKDTLDFKKDTKTEELHAQFFKNGKTTSIPRFFDYPTKNITSAKPHQEISEDSKILSLKKIDDGLSARSNDNYRSRSHSRQENFTRQKSYGRNRSSSTNWRCSLASSSHINVYYVIKIADLQNGTFEKVQILKDDYLAVKREKSKLSEILPHPGYKLGKIHYSASAVKMFVRCVFSKSYKIPGWLAALEGFVLAKKFGLNGLRQACEDYFINIEIPPEKIQQVVVYAQQLQAVDAFKSSKLFKKVQNVTGICSQNAFMSKSCSVSCAILMEPTEFSIPLLSEVNVGLESCNEADVINTLFFRSLDGVTSLTGIQLKFLMDDNMNTELHIVCEVFLRKEKLFYKDFDTKAKSSIPIWFGDEIKVKSSERVKISLVIDEVLLKMCPQLTDDEYVSRGKFHSSFESSKTSGKNKLFCIEKLFYTPSA